MILDINTILSDNGKLCLLLPDKDFTFDHYRENCSFADWYDVYIRGEKNNTPRLLLDSRMLAISENSPSKFWQKNVSIYPDPNVDNCIKLYSDFINDFENNYFSGHYWVFTDQSFLKILASLFRLNILPYKLVSFFPTAYNDNTFGLILEKDENIKKNLEIRNQQIKEIYNIINIINQKRLELEINHIIQENIELKKIVTNLKNILKSIENY